MAQLTKQTWRKGKKRRMIKRVRSWGGQTKAPEGFEAAGVDTRFGGSREPRRCSSKKRDGTQCRAIALRGLTVCGAHGGFSVKARQEALQPSGRSEAYRASLPELDGAGVPLELAQMAFYREAAPRDRIRLAQAWQGAAWRLTVERVKARGEGN